MTIKTFLCSLVRLLIPVFSQFHGTWQKEWMFDKITTLQVWCNYRQLFQLPNITVKDEIYIEKFYSFYWNGMVSPSRLGAEYVRMYKAGNDAIRLNMKLPPFNEATFKGHHFYFTFVRRPITRFLSGYNEIFCRHVEDIQIKGVLPVSNCAVVSWKEAGACLTGNKRLTNEDGVRMFKEFIHSVLIDDVGLGKEHVFAMSGILKRFKLNFVGDIQHVKKQWLQLQTMIGVPIGEQKSFNSSVHIHRSSTDPYGAYNGARQAIKAPSILQLLCHLLLPDFYYFDFKWPQACEPEPM